MSEVKYCFYATLIDSFQGWLSSSEIYQDYWGFSEEPAKSEDEFEKEQFQSLIDKINRVPMNWADSEAADRGTAFNEAVDALIHNRKSDKVELKSNKDTGTITANYNNRTFVFPLSLVREFSDYFKDAASQVYTEGIINTKYGYVKLYGYIDEVTPGKIHDIKTTGKYKAGKFRNNWQHIIYPFCLHSEEIYTDEFEYNIALFSGNNVSTYTEYYRFKDDRDIPKLRNIVEQFIEFVEANKQLITDKKIFNESNNS